MEGHTAARRVADEAEAVAFHGLVEGDRGHGDEAAAFRGHHFHQGQIFELRHDARLDLVLAKPRLNGAAKRGVLRWQERRSVVE